MSEVSAFSLVKGPREAGHESIDDDDSDLEDQLKAKTYTKPVKEVAPIGMQFKPTGKVEGDRDTVVLTQLTQEAGQQEGTNSADKRNMSLDEDEGAQIKVRNF